MANYKPYAPHIEIGSTFKLTLPIDQQDNIIVLYNTVTLGTGVVVLVESNTLTAYQVPSGKKLRIIYIRFEHNNVVGAQTWGEGINTSTMSSVKHGTEHRPANGSDAHSTNYFIQANYYAVFQSVVADTYHISAIGILEDA